MYFLVIIRNIQFFHLNLSTASFYFTVYVYLFTVVGTYHLLLPWLRHSPSTVEISVNRNLLRKINFIQEVLELQRMLLCVMCLKSAHLWTLCNFNRIKNHKIRFWFNQRLKIEPKKSNRRNGTILRIRQFYILGTVLCISTRTSCAFLKWPETIDFNFMFHQVRECFIQRHAQY